MKQILDQFLQLLQQGIAAIFRFVGLVWAWSADQIDKILQVPLENWPLWKQILLVLVVAAVIYALFIAAWRLWIASVRALAAFASLVAALIVALGRLDNGLGLYRFRYLWSDEVFVGVMAQEVAKVVPEAVAVGPEGYMKVDYGRLGLHMQTWEQWASAH